MFFLRHHIDLNYRSKDYAYLSRLVETAVMTLAVPLIGYGIDKSDPFFLSSSFPWLIIPPLLLGLNYGLAYGMVSFSLYAGCLALGWYFEFPVVPAFPAVTLFGIFVMTLVVSEFHALRNRRLYHAETKYKSLKIRMENFARIYQALKGSHTQLEQMISSGHPVSLRSSMTEFEQDLLDIDKEIPVSGEVIGQLVLELFRKHTHVNSARIYSVHTHQPVFPDLASIGNPAADISLNNDLLKIALSTHHIASTSDEPPEGAMVIIPIVDAYDKCWQIIVVSEMPLFALSDDNLDLQAVLAGRIGDLLRRYSEAHPKITTGHKLSLFENHLRRTIKEVRLFNKPAAILAITVPNANPDASTFSGIVSETRYLDKVWTFQSRQKGCRVDIKLMPLTDKKGVSDYLKRMGYPVPDEKRGAVPAGDNTVHVSTWYLNAKDTAEDILFQLDSRFQLTENAQHSNL